MNYSEHYINYTVLPTFREIADPTRAAQQKRYLKNHFEFLGLRNAETRKIAYALIKEDQLATSEHATDLMLTAMEAPFREINYFAIDLAVKSGRHQPSEFIQTIETLISTNSWWDSVDALAKVVDLHFRRFPELESPTTNRWINSDSIWLQRSCLIFQLSRKQDTNTELLASMILKTASSKEFFLQKAAGWALRQYSRTDAEWVETFVDDYELPALTVREALRLIRK